MDNIFIKEKNKGTKASPIDVVSLKSPKCPLYVSKGVNLEGCSGWKTFTLQKRESEYKIKILNLMEKYLKTSEIICPCSKIISLD